MPALSCSWLVLAGGPAVPLNALLPLLHCSSRVGAAVAQAWGKQLQQARWAAHGRQGQLGSASSPSGSQPASPPATAPAGKPAAPASQQPRRTDFPGLHQAPLLWRLGVHIPEAGKGVVHRGVQLPPVCLQVNQKPDALPAHQQCSAGEGAQ